MKLIDSSKDLSEEVRTTNERLSWMNINRGYCENIMARKDIGAEYSIIK